MFLSQKKYSFFEVPVSIFLASPNFQVKLTLLGIGSNGDMPQTFMSQTYEMKKLNPVTGGWLYAVVLNQNDFPRSTTYHGIIRATNNDTGETTIIDADVRILIEESELSIPSKTQLFGKYLSYAELLDYVAGGSLSYAFPTDANTNGDLTVKILNGYKFPLVIRNDSDGGPLPLGSYIEIFDQKTGHKVPFSNGYNGGLLQAPLAWTNPDGTVQGEGNPQKIADSIVSYTYIGGLPKGRYFAKVFATGKQPDPIFFNFPNRFCN